MPFSTCRTSWLIPPSNDADGVGAASSLLVRQSMDTARKDRCVARRRGGRGSNDAGGGRRNAEFGDRGPGKRKAGRCDAAKAEGHTTLSNGTRAKLETRSCQVGAVGPPVPPCPQAESTRHFFATGFLLPYTTALFKTQEHMFKRSVNRIMLPKAAAELASKRPASFWSFL